MSTMKLKLKPWLRNKLGKYRHKRPQRNDPGHENGQNGLSATSQASEGKDAPDNSESTTKPESSERPESSKKSDCPTKPESLKKYEPPRRRLQRKANFNRTPPPDRTLLNGMPRLREIREYTLTPSPSRECFALGSPFFEKLPGEIRRTILIHAFGGRVIHMDLSYDHPPSVWPTDRGPAQTHAGLHWNRSNPPRVVRQFSQPKSWRWWSSVCHRIPPAHLQELSTQDWFPEPSSDNCRQGVDQFCNSYPGDAPWRCHVGAMGWLLSCRQAYVEGIDVLYKTNTIHMTGEALLTNLPKLLLPQRLHAITALEIIWSLKLTRIRDEGVVPGEGRLETILDALYSNFPSLYRLHLSFKADSGVDFFYFFLNKYEPNFEVILGSIDEFLLRHPALSQFAVSFPPGLYAQLFEPTPDIMEVSQREEAPLWPTEFWRNLDGTPVMVEEEISPYPKPLRGTSEVENDAGCGGYWIVEADVGEDALYKFPRRGVLPH